MAHRRQNRNPCATSAPVLNIETIRSCIGDAVEGLSTTAVLQRINGATVEQVLAAAIDLLCDQLSTIMELEDEIKRQGAALDHEVGDLRAHLANVSERLARLPDHSSNGGSAP